MQLVLGFSPKSLRHRAGRQGRCVKGFVKMEAGPGPHLWLRSAPALELENRCVCSPLSHRTVPVHLKTRDVFFLIFSCGHMESII